MTCEFSLAHYEECLEKMEGIAGTVTENKQILLCHDIDIFPRYALELARREYQHDIKATYYVLLHSEWYNALSPENMKVWQELRELGHELALHYDGNYDYQLEIIHKAFCALVKTDSIHISHHLVGITPVVDYPAHLRGRSTITKHRYIADSGGWFRNGCICQHLDEKLLAVLHAIWWVKGQNPFDEVTKDAYEVVDRARTFWKSMVHEHRKQAIQVTARSA